MKKIYLEPSIDMMEMDNTPLLADSDTSLRRSTLYDDGSDDGDGVGESKQLDYGFGTSFGDDF